MYGRGIRQYLPAAQDVLHMTLTLLLPPAIFIYEILYILPAMNASVIHTYVAIFLLHNVGGNAVCGILSGPRSFLRNYKVTEEHADWRFCATCDRNAPPRSWHCSVCNVCVLKRDHHCNFFGQCIGYYNHRFFVMFIFHVFLATFYAFCFNLIYMIYYFKWDVMGWLSLLKFVFPLAAVAFHFGEESFDVLFFVITLIAMLFTGFLLVYHGRIVFRGQITPESKKQMTDIYNLGWKGNLMDILGERWYLTWISPLLRSKLPGDGINWVTRDVQCTEISPP